MNITRETACMDLPAAIVDTIFERMFRGECVVNILKEQGMPSMSSFYRAVINDPFFREKYTWAQKIRSEVLVEETISIADNELDPQKARNRIQTRQWYASKMNPQKYGERIDLNVTQKVDLDTAIAEARARIKRPVSDQLDITDVQVIETKQEALPTPTDKQSETVLSKLTDADYASVFD